MNRDFKKEYNDLTQDQLEQIGDAAIIEGLFEPTSDGKFKPTEKGYKLMQKMFDEHPEAYPLVFRDRLN